MSTEHCQPTDSTLYARPITWVFLVSAAVLMLACCWLVDFDRILRRMPDDAYYYLKIAENVAEGNGSTFDGIHKTSGYQPLWMLCLVPVFWICPHSPETAVRIALSLQIAIMLAAAALIVSVLSKVFSWRVILGIAVAYTLSVFVLAVNGMESALLVLALGGLFAYGWHADVFSLADTPDAPSLGKQFVFGVLLGVVMLSRLDTVFLGAVIVAFCAWPAVRKTGWCWRSLAGPATIVAGASLVVTPYLAYNFATFGKLSPISGTLKSSFPRICPLESWEALRYCLGLPKILLVATILVFAVLYVVGYLHAVRSTSNSSLKKGSGARFYFHTSMAVLACAILLHGLHTICFMQTVWAWHFFPCYLFAALAIGVPLEKLISTRIGGAVYGWALVGLVAVGVWSNVHRLTVTGDAPTWQTVSYEASLWAREHTAPSDVFALKDAGNFGYFSQRRVINLDGLVNNLDYQDVLKAQSLKSYFEKNRVKYLVLHSTSESHPRVFDRTYEDDSVVYRSSLHNALSDPIPLKKRDEVFRETYRFPTRDDFVIWDISAVTKPSASNAF